MALRFSTGLRNKLLGKTVNTVTNGSFSSDTSDWSAIDATLASVSGGQSGNCLQITNNTSSQGYAYQAQSVKHGHYYLIDLYHKNGTAQGVVKIGTSPNDDSLGSRTLNDTDWAHYFFLVEAPDVTSIYITLVVNSNTSGDTTLFDEVRCIWESSSIQEIFKNSKLLIYSGTQPSSADEAPTGTKLVEITVNGSGDFNLQFEDAGDGSINKVASDNWSGTAIADGTAGWFRLIAVGDSGVYSTSDPRIDGSVGTANAELIMADTNITTGSVQTISVFKLNCVT